MTQLAITEVGPMPDPKFAQWFTTPALAARMAAWMEPWINDARQRRFCMRILEPSAGSGNIVRAFRDACGPGAHIHAVEIDPRWAAHLREQGTCTVYEGDYLARRAPELRYDLCASNPPFDGGEEVDHVEKMLEESERVLLEIPVRTLHGSARFTRIWRHFNRTDGEWWLRREARLVRRPKYGGEGGGSDEIIVVDLRRVPGPCDVEWWEL